MLSIVMPCYEEEKNLKILLPDIKKNIHGIDYEILIIDTTKRLDKTDQIAKINKVKYFNRIPDNSYGSAIRTGISKAKGNLILFMDADGSHDPSYIPKLLKYVDEYDVVSASRYIPGGKTDNTLILNLMSIILNKSYTFILGIPMKDVSNSMKIYKSEDLKKLNLISNNFDIIEEIIIKLISYKNCKIKEIPFYFKKRNEGVTKRNLIKFIFSYISTIYRLWRFKKNSKK